MEMLIVALVVLAVVLVSVWAARRVKHPEQAASHDDTGRDSTSDRFYNETDRPAGPEAEDPTMTPNRFPSD